MSLIILNVDEVRRTLSASGGAFVTHDKEVDIVRFAINSGFADIVLDGQVALRVMYQRPGETEVRAQTLTYYDTDGLHNYYDWQLSQSDLAKNGSLMVALCILDISGGEVSEWHTTPCAVRVLSTIHTDDSDEGDDTITPTVRERVAVLESMIQRVASGAPIVVSSTSAMTDTSQIYVLSTDGNWYYHNGTAWTAGGEYGAVSTDTTLTQSGIPADAKAVGDGIATTKAGFWLEDFTLSVSQYQHGTIDEAGQNSAYRSASRVRTISPTAYPVDLLISVPSGTFQVIVALYESDGTFISISSWQDSIVVPAGTYFRIMARVVPEVETEIDTFAESISFKSLFASAITENLEKKIIKLDPNINEFDTFLFEKGALDDSGNNSAYMGSYRARSKDKIVYDYDVNIVSNDGFKFFVATYETDGTFIASSLWQKSAIIPANTYFRIVITTQPTPTSGDPIPLATLVGGIGYVGASAKATEDTVLDYANDNVRLPSYYDTYIKEKAVDIQSKAVRNGISFAFITDVHVENNAGKSPALIKYLAGHTNCVPFVIFGGDVPMDRVNALNDVNEQANKWISWVNAMHVDHVYQCIGNHDYHGLISENGNLVNYGLSQNLVYNYVMGRQMLDVHAPYGEKYYYFDIVPSKTRIVVLDCYDTARNYPTAFGYTGISETQLTWLANEAFGNVDGYNIIVIAHQSFDPDIGGASDFAMAFSLIKAFANKTTFTSGNVSADFTQNTNTFVMHLVGHAHYDRSHVSDNVLTVVTTSDARYTGVSIDSNRVIGTVSEQAFDIFTIDYDERSISTTRIGYGADRNFTY